MSQIILTKKIKRSHSESTQGLGKRFIVVTASIFLMGLSVAGLKIVGMGTDPLSTFSFGMEHVTGITMGTCEAIINLLLFIPVIRYDRTKLGIGTLLNMLVIGYIVSFTLMLVKPLLPAGGLVLIPKLLLLIISAAGFMLSCAFYTAADLGLCPYDAIPVMIANRFPQMKFRWIRMAWDALFLSIGTVCGSSFGITSLIIVFGSGPIIGLIVNRFHMNRNNEKP